MWQRLGFWISFIAAEALVAIPIFVPDGRDLVGGNKPAIVWAACTVLLILMGIWLYPRRARKLGLPEKTQEAIQAALAEKDPESQKKPYTYADYQKDLRDGNVSLEDILAKCGGVIPKEPEKPTDKGGVWAETLPKPDKQTLSRIMERQDWVEMMLRTNPNLKVVPAPVPIPVVSVGGQMVPCKCECHGLGLLTSPGFNYGGNSAFPTRCPGKCRGCGGTGYVIVTKG